MKILNIRIVFDRKGETKTNPKKTGLIHIEVVERDTKRKKYIYTGVKVLANQYSQNGVFSIKNHPNAIVLKAKVLDVYNKIEAFIHSDKCTCFDDVQNWDARNDTNISLLEYLEKEISRKPIEHGTKKAHYSLFHALVRFGKIRYFKDLTYSNIADFDVFFRKNIKSQPVLYKRHNTLNSYIKEAQKRKLIINNPYDEFHSKKGKSKNSITLDEVEIKKLIDYKPTCEKLEKIRDMYLFQCMTKSAFIDMQDFSKYKVIHVDGSIVICSNRVKTDESYIIPLFAEAQEIMEKYNYTFPRISNQKYNDYIKVLASHVGIDKKLTSHTARHTFGTYLVNKGVPIAAIQKAMGHAKITQTLEYAKLSARSVKNEILQVAQNNRFVS